MSKIMLVDDNEKVIELYEGLFKDVSGLEIVNI